jgi:D-alanyl-D-alanine carboxypeptidase
MKFRFLKSRDDYIVNTCKGKNILHIGAADWPYTQEKLDGGNLLYALLDNVVKSQVGIDLDKEAFKKISSPSAGIIQVKIEPLRIVKDKSQRTLGLTDKGAHLEPEISAQAAAIIDEENGEVLWQKNGEEVLPIASLTKLMAVKVFLDNNRDLKQVVEYKYQDEEYNYQYCEKWESSRLRLDEGDKLTVNDLIYSSLVRSANNTVETLVRYSGLSRDAFIQAMNDEAKTLGAESTYFEEPTGLSTKNVSSALDYAIKYYVCSYEFQFDILEKLYAENYKQDNKLVNSSYIKIRNKYKVFPLILFRHQKRKNINLY